MPDLDVKTSLSDGSPVTSGYTTIGPDGQQKGYLVIDESVRSQRERIRPVRRVYRHVGATPPRYPLRDLDETEEHLRQSGFVSYEEYPAGSALAGRYWSKEMLSRVNAGCNEVTTMALSIAETFAVNPYFYSGTYCVCCRKHLPVGEHGEFIWDDGSGERVGT